MEVFDECDECNGTGLYFIDDEPRKCICVEDEEELVKTTRSKLISRYDVPGAGAFIVTEDGCFAAYTSYENVIFKWPKQTSLWEFERFLIQVAGSREYLKGKFFTPVYDSPATIKAIKSNILLNRIDRWLGKDQAREEWELVRMLENASIGFEEWANNTNIDDPWEFRQECYTNSQNHFVDVCYQEFARFLQAEHTSRLQEF